MSDAKKMNDTYTRALEHRIKMLMAKVEAQRWIPVSERLPEPHMKVVAYYQNSNGLNRRVMGYYIPRFHTESSCDDEYCWEWDEAEETAYLKEGWYEQLDNWEDYGSVVIYQGEVTHWMPLPAPPETGGEKGE